MANKVCQRWGGIRVHMLKWAFPVLECRLYYSVRTYSLNNNVCQALSGHFCSPPAVSRLLVTCHQSSPQLEKQPLSDPKSVWSF